MSEHDDALERALGAYASSTRGEALDSAGLRRRILSDVAAPARRAPRKLSFVLALAATFAASAAFAATQPAVREAVQRSFQSLFGAPERPAPARPALPHGNPARAASAVQQAPSSAPESGPAPISPGDLPVLPRASASHAPTPVASAQTPSTSPAGSGAPVTSPSAAAFDAQVESYRKAHRLHFGGSAPAQTLAAWDEYLAAYPDGSFATDARFNRALCLLRLGRRDEARAALGPFAEAPVGSYRQQEAASLLLSLESQAK